MNVIKKIIDILSSVALVAFVLLVILLAGVRLFGLDPHIVLSGSMEPEIMTGSLVYVDRLSPEEACALEVGDTVTYVADKSGTKVTHRIYEVVGPLYVKNQHGELVLDANGQPIVAEDDGGYPIIMYTTYGINNKNETTSSGYTLDGTQGVGNLASSNVLGKPLFAIPFLGYVAHFVQNPPGNFVVIVICALLLCGAIFGDRTKTTKKDENASESEATDSDGTVPQDEPSDTEATNEIKLE